MILGGNELDVEDIPLPLVKRRRVVRRLRPDQCGSSDTILLHMQVFIENFVNNMDYKNPNHEDFLMAVDFLVTLGHTIQKDAQIGCAKRLLKVFAGLPPMATNDELSKYLLPRSVKIVGDRSVDLLTDDYVRTCRALALDYKKLNGATCLSQPQLRQLIKFCASGSWKEHGRRFVETKRAASQKEEEEEEFGEMHEEGYMKRHMNLAKRAAVHVNRLVRLERLDAIDVIASQVYIENGLDKSKFQDEQSRISENDNMLFHASKPYFRPTINRSNSWELQNMSYDDIVREVSCPYEGEFAKFFVDGALFESTPLFVLSVLKNIEPFCEEYWIESLHPRLITGLAFESELQSHDFAFSSLIRVYKDASSEYAPEFDITKKIIEIKNDAKYENPKTHCLLFHLGKMLNRLRSAHQGYKPIGEHTVFFNYYIRKKVIRPEEDDFSQDGIRHTHIRFTDLREYACFCENREEYLQRHFKNLLVRLVNCIS